MSDLTDEQKKQLKEFMLMSDNKKMVQKTFEGFVRQLNEKDTQINELTAQAAKWQKKYFEGKNNV